jgi:phosphomannomutase
MALMFSVSGLRGIANTDLTQEIAVSVTRAFAAFMKAHTIVLGRDTRPSSSMFAKAITEALKTSGCRVINLDIVPTPTVLFIVRRVKADAGIMITASHNPIDNNGIKLINSRGEFLDDKAVTDFLAFIRQPVRPASSSVKSPVVMYSEAVDRHISEILDVLDMGKKEEKDKKSKKDKKGKKVSIKTETVAVPLRIAVDAVSGAGSYAMSALLERLGCTVFRLNCEFRSAFPRPPEPTPENITGLCELVKQEHCDLGFAVDPDCDRLSIVDDQGNAIGEENTLVLAAEQVLGAARRKTCLVTNLSTTSRMDHIARQYRSRLIRTMVGEAHVVDAIKKAKAMIGGEGNGGVIYPRINATRDALVAAALVIKLLTSRKQKLSELISQYPPLYMVKEKIETTKDKFLAKQAAIIRAFKGKVNKIDGLKITKKDSWVHIRPSNTEPLVRIIAEASDQKTVKEIVRSIRRILKK